MAERFNSQSMRTGEETFQLNIHKKAYSVTRCELSDNVRARQCWGRKINTSEGPGMNSGLLV